MVHDAASGFTIVQEVHRQTAATSDRQTAANSLLTQVRGSQTPPSADEGTVRDCMLSLSTPAKDRLLASCNWAALSWGERYNLLVESGHLSTEAGAASEVAAASSAPNLNKAPPDAGASEERSVRLTGAPMLTQEVLQETPSTHRPTCDTAS